MELDPRLLEQLIPKAKKQLRARMKALRTALPLATRRAKSAAIVNALSAREEFASAKRIALYWPVDAGGEVDIRALDAAARLAGKLVYYPFMDVDGDVIRTGFRKVTRPEDMQDRGRGFKEPSTELEAAAAGDLDLVVLPALAVGADGHRLGYGSGFYDATAPEFAPPAKLVVVAYDFQLLAEVPSTPADVPVHVIITDRRVLLVGSALLAENERPNEGTTTEATRAIPGKGEPQR